MNKLAPSTPPEAFGRYLLYPAIARGGMATVHTARLVGAEGFTRLVAAKRLHPQFTDDPDFVTMFRDEACIASRIHHPNVVPVLDVVVSGNELILVQEYVHGVPLSQLMKIAQCAAEPISVDIIVAVLVGVLAGLHAAHEVRDELDRPLEIVHRDVSPANVMISVDGIPRLLDFGIAKARTSTHHTREGVFKGKLAYMAPEQLRMETVDRTVDVYAAGVLAWELLVNRRVYDNRHELAFVAAVMNDELPSISAALEETRESVDDDRWAEILALEPIVTRAMSPRSEERFATAADMAHAILEIRVSATSMAVIEWVRSAGADFLDQRQRVLAANEESWRRGSLYTPTPMSGMQRAADRTSTPSPVPNAPRSLSVVSARSSAPPNPTLTPHAWPSVPPSSPPPRWSGSARITLAAPAVARLGAALRASRLLPWIAAAGLVVAALIGGLLRGSSAPHDSPPVDSAPALGAAPPAAATTPAVGIALAVVPPLAVSAAPGASPSAAAAVAPPASPAIPVASLPTPAPAVPPVSAPGSIAWRPVHVLPPPPPLRWVPPPRPAGPPSAGSTGPASASASTTSRADCNPPFFFEGTKKIFKPSCL